MPLFGPPNVEKLKARRDIAGLVKALAYKKSWLVRQAAAGALGKIGALAWARAASESHDWQALAAVFDTTDYSE